jgi:hypothetical protein
MFAFLLVIAEKNFFMGPVVSLEDMTGLLLVSI